MALANIFTKEISDKVIGRIEKLSPQTQPGWGKMSVAQMLAHCSVTYEMVYETKHAKPGFFMKLIMMAIVKNAVVSETPFKPNTKTAPAFIISNVRDFEKEKKRLINYVVKTQELGAVYFDNKESLSFGRLSKEQWNNMFYKHIDHHLTQFGV